VGAWDRDLAEAAAGKKIQRVVVAGRDYEVDANSQMLFSKVVHAVLVMDCLIQAVCRFLGLITEHLSCGSYSFRILRSAPAHLKRGGARPRASFSLIDAFAVADPRQRGGKEE